MTIAQELAKENRLLRVRIEELELELERYRAEIRERDSRSIYSPREHM